MESGFMSIPTWLIWALILLAVALAIALFLVFSKILPGASVLVSFLRIFGG